MALWIDRILGGQTMGLLALAALSMAIQVNVFGVPDGIHEMIRRCQILVFLLFFAEYFNALIRSPDRRHFITRPSRIFDLIILTIVMLSFLPEVEDRLINSQALQILRLGPVLFFGYVGTRELSQQLISREETIAPQVMEFFKGIWESGGLRHEQMSQDEALAWMSNTDREGITVCRGSVTTELAERLSDSKIPSSLLKNALSQSSFPRAVRVANLYVLAGALPQIRPAANGPNQIERVTFVTVFTQKSVMLINSKDVRLPEEIVNLIQAESILPDQAPPYRFLVGLFKLMLERYEACAFELETQLRSTELEPLSKTGGGIYHAMYLLRRTISNLKSDIWRLRHILHAIEEGRRPTIFKSTDCQDLFGLMCHSADYLHESFEELDEKASALLDLRINLVSFEMNKFMGLLAVVTAIGLIPASFGGLLGMNVEGTNFPITLGNVSFLCLALILMTLYVMRINGWLRFR